MELLAQLGCHTLIQYIHSHSQLSCETFALRVFPSIEATISSKEKTTIVISAETINRSTGLFASVYPGQSFARMCIHYRPQNNDYPRHNKAKYDLYTGIKAQICSVFSKNSQQLTKEQVTNCAQIFNREIERFREVFDENLNACISQGKKEFEQLIPDFEAMKTEAIEGIKIKAKEMRENEEISKTQNEYLESIQRLLDRADALTKI